MASVTRTAVLAYRAAVHEVQTAAATADECGVLAVGVQDTPPGTTARLALGARSRAGPREPASLALVYSVRGTLHLHRVGDLDLLAAALHPRAPDELARATHGTHFRDLPVPLRTALDEVASAMR